MKPPGQRTWIAVPLRQKRSPSRTARSFVQGGTNWLRTATVRHDVHCHCRGVVHRRGDGSASVAGLERNVNPTAVGAGKDLPQRIKGWDGRVRRITSLPGVKVASGPSGDGERGVLL